MLNKIKNFFELSRIGIIRLTISILFRKKSQPIVLKYLEMKLNIITAQEFEGWVMSDALGL